MGCRPVKSIRYTKEHSYNSTYFNLPRLHIPFMLHTDASADGLGAVLYKDIDGAERVIAYASRSLKPSEKNYPAHKLEFLVNIFMETNFKCSQITNPWHMC